MRESSIPTIANGVTEQTGVGVSLEPLANGPDIGGHQGSTRVLDVGGCVPENATLSGMTDPPREVACVESIFVGVEH